MPKAIKVHPGDKYERLTIIEEVEKYKGKRYFRCVCECGNEGIYRFVAMRAGRIKSCGCLRKEQNKVASKTHGYSGTPLYSSWHSMKQRCLNKNSAVYHYYGDRGISICEEWLDFEPFKKWALSHGYRKGLTIDRIDFNGNYTPSNCRWITMAEQSRNTRRNVRISFNGENNCLEEWANKIGLSPATLKKRLRRWPLHRALTEKPHKEFISKKYR